MLTSLDHSSLQPWLYGCSLAVCSALYAFFAFAALVIPTHGLAIGTSLLRGTYLRTDGEDRLAWAVGLIDVGKLLEIPRLRRMLRSHSRG